MTSSSSGADDQPARSTHSASSGGPASDPRLPVCASRPLIAPIARGLARRPAAPRRRPPPGTRPPTANESAKPAIAACVGTGSEGRRRPAPSKRPCRPRSAGRGERRAASSSLARLPDDAEGGCDRHDLPGLGRRPARVLDEVAGSSPASARKSNAKQKRRRRAAPRSRSAPSAASTPVLAVRRPQASAETAMPHAVQQHDVDGKIVRQPRGRRAPPRHAGERDAGGDEGAPQREGDRLVARSGRRDHQRRRCDHDQQIADARQARAANSMVPSSAAAHRSPRRRP